MGAFLGLHEQDIAVAAQIGLPVRPRDHFNVGEPQGAPKPCGGLAGALTGTAVRQDYQEVLGGFQAVDRGGDFACVQTPQKVRLVADMVRGQAVEPALTSLQLSPKYAAKDVAKVIKSALANLEQGSPGVDVDNVFIKKISVDDGPRLRRGRPASKWVRMHRILKRMCHITVELAVRES